MNTKVFSTDDVAVTAMIREVLSRESGSREGQSTYLRTLVAAVQEGLGRSPTLAPVSGRAKRIPIERALEALETAHGRFYGIVLQEVNTGDDARTRNAQTGFARSAASTLRSAVRLGLNPLTLVVPAVTKESLRAWAREHTPEVPVDATEATKQAGALLDQLAELMESVPEDEREDVLEQVHAKLESLGTLSSLMEAPQRPVKSNGNAKKVEERVAA